MSRFIEYKHKRYVRDSKAFEKLVNAERKDGNRVFNTISIGGKLFAPNPVTHGKGSQNAYVEIETNNKGQTTKRGQAALARVNTLWDNKYFVKAGQLYSVNWRVKFTLVRTLKDGSTIRGPRDELYPLRAHFLPPEFDDNRFFKTSRNMSRVDFLFFMIEEVLLKQFGNDSEPEDINTVSLSVTPIAKSYDLADAEMNSVKMLYKSIDNNIETRPGSCVADYIISELHKPSARLQHVKRTDIQHLKTTRDIITWAQEMECISVYALNPLFKVFEKHQSTNARATLIFVCNNNHLYPITDETQRRKVVQCGRLQLENIDLLKVDMETVTYYDGEERYITSSDMRKRIDNFIEFMVDFVEATNNHIVLPFDSLELIAIELMKRTGTLIECFNYYNNNLTAFKHPTRDILIIAGRDFAKRREICTQYFNKYKVIDFKFTNQSWGEIGRLILEHCYHVIPRSNYSPHWMKIFEQYPITPYRICNDKTVKSFTTLDVRGCYPSIKEKNQTAWNIGGTFDDIKPFKYESEDDFLPGEYYISRDFYMGKGTIFISKAFYPLDFVKYALDHKYITTDDITQSITADKHIKHDAFKQFVSDMFEQFPNEAKDIVNMFIGCMGSLYHRTAQTAITTDFETAAATVCGIEHAQMFELNDLYIIQNCTQKMKTSGDMPIYRQIIAASLCKLDEMVRLVNPQKIIGYNTDSVKFCGSYNSQYVKPKTECKRGEYHEEKPKNLYGRHVSLLDRHAEYKHVPAIIRKIDENAINYNDILNNGGLIMGGGGCGKTHLGVDMVKSLSPEELDKTAILSYSHAATENLKNRGCETAQTFKSLLWVGAKMSIAPLEKYKRVILDEFGLLPPYEMGLLLNAKIQYGLSIICIGDPNQCKAPVHDFVNYHTNPLFLEMCNNTVLTMTYKPGFARYDTALYTALTGFLKTKNLSGWNCDEVESYQNICYTNETRKAINKKCLARWVAERGAELVNFVFPVAVGLPVMCYDDSDKIQKVFKTQIFTICDIKKDTITLKTDDKIVTYDKDLFKRFFDYAFAYTVHKCQGITIEGHYNIYEGHRMTCDVLYTAMSRGTRREYVHIVSKRNLPYLENHRPISIEHKLFQAELKSGTIYNITLSNGMFYIGKTNKTITERLAEHLKNPTNDEMAAALDDHATIAALETFFYKSERVFRLIEEQYINHFIENGYALANVQHNKKAAATPAKLKTATKRPSINITECARTRRFIIRLRRDGVDDVDKVKYFSFGSNKAEALKAAETHRAYLLFKYY